MTSRWIGFAGVLVSVLFSTACGDDPECAIDTDCPLYQRCTADFRCVPLGAPEAGVDAGDASMDAGVDAEAGPPDAEPPDAEPVGVGIVRVTANGVNATASATFDPTGPGVDCEVEELGACNVRRCTRTIAPMVDAGVDAAVMDAAVPDAAVPDAEVRPHAEAITVRGAAGEILLLEDPLGIYGSSTGTTPWSMAEPAVGISGVGGGGVDAFEIALNGPSPITVTTPAGLEGITSFTAGTAIDLVWTGASAGNLRLDVDRPAWLEGEETQVSLICRFPLDPTEPTGGSATVQGAILRELTVGVPYRLTIRAEALQETMAGGWIVRGVADSLVTTSTGAIFTGSSVTIAASP